MYRSGGQRVSVDDRKRQGFRPDGHAQRRPKRDHQRQQLDHQLGVNQRNRLQRRRRLERDQSLDRNAIDRCAEEHVYLYPQLYGSRRHGGPIGNRDRQRQPDHNGQLERQSQYGLQRQCIHPDLGSKQRDDMRGWRRLVRQ